MTFPNFIAKFETLAYQCRKTDEQKVDAFKKNVSQELAEKPRILTPQTNA
jgi:hypothetical protein